MEWRGRAKCSQKRDHGMLISLEEDDKPQKTTIRRIDACSTFLLNLLSHHICSSTFCSLMPFLGYNNKINALLIYVRA